MSVQDTALIVIDVQESFRQAPYWDASELPAYLSRQQALIDGAKAAGMPIVQVFHVDADAPFTVESGFVRTLNEITIVPDVTFHKGVHSALVDTGLEAWLREKGIRRVIVSGIRTEQCCETTTRHASDLGFAVDHRGDADLPDDACLGQSLLRRGYPHPHRAGAFRALCPDRDGRASAGAPFRRRRLRATP